MVGYWTARLSLVLTEMCLYLRALQVVWSGSKDRFIYAQILFAISD